MTYLPIVIMIALAGVVGLAILALSTFFGPKIKHLQKDQPFECGVPAYGDAKHRFSVRFYLVAILFLLFDVEAIFFFPFAVTFKEYLGLGAFILFEMAFFVLILLVGYFYVLRKGALEWD